MKITKEDCQSCRCIDKFAKFSNWGYCTNPNYKEFAIIRWASDFTNKPYKIRVPSWCIKK